MSMTRVVHLIPHGGIGGVETAAGTMGRVRRGEIEFEVEFIFAGLGTNNESGKWKTFNPMFVLAAARRNSRRDVDLLIVSLWRSAIAGLLAKVLRPGLRLVVFLHSPDDAHIVDRMATRLSVRIADEIWADSGATLRQRVPGLPAEKCRIISFVTRRFEPLPRKGVEPSFVFWGRLDAAKALDRAIRLFSVIRMTYPTARFWIIGPDGGALHSLQGLCELLGLKDAVLFMGSGTHDDIRHFARGASFYLQTSRFEGMAMAVVEAMQMGLVPVVTPVGEIGAYCRSRHNAVLVDTDQQAVNDVLELLDSNDRYEALRNNSIATWRDHPLYRDSVLDACRSLLEQEIRIQR